MNKLLYCFFLSFSVIATSACTDDKEEREFPPAPDFSLMILKENLHSNGGDVLRTDTYVYDNNKLTTHTTLQEFYGQSLTHETTLSYSDAIAELETIVNKLQNNEYEIDELQKCTTRSLELLKFCKSKLFETDEALQKILAELND